MERQFTKADFYLILFVLGWWREEAREDAEWEELYQSRRTLWNMGDPADDRTKLIDLAKRILAVVRSYPPEESDEDSEIEAGSEGDSESSEEENESGLANN
jgi:hypothetical protein